MRGIINKKLLSIVLIFSILLSFAPIYNINSYADNSKNEIEVRIEGKTNTLFDKKIKVNENMKTPLDVLKVAVGEENIEGIKNGSMGYFITGILKEKQEENFGWCYYVKFNDGNIIFPNLGVDKFDGMTNLNNELISNELVFYISAYSGVSITTKIPKVTVEKNKTNFKIKVVNNEVGNEPIKDVNITVGNEGTYKTNAEGEASFSLSKSGKYNVDISKDKDYPMIVRQHLVIESEGSSNETKDIIEELKEVYKDKKDLNAIEVMSYNSLMNDKNDFKTTFKMNDSNNVGAYAENIMGCLATGQDSSIYVDKALENVQNEESITAISEAIVALDMAKAKYDIEKIVKLLVSKASDGHYEDATTTAYALKALLKHQEIDGVNNLISSCKSYLKNQQLDNGGYDYCEMGNSPYATGPVIQALIMAGENLESSDWKKSEKTLINSLLACKIEGKGFEIAQGMGAGFDDLTATQFAFAALSDVYSGKSMYDRFTCKDSGTAKNYEELIDNSIDGIRDYLKSMQTRLDAKYVEHPAFYRPLEILALNCTSKDIQSDIKDLSEKFTINKNEGTLPYIFNIIGLKASGENPQKYIDLIIGSQQKDGNFKVGKVKQTEWAVIALDMVGAKYDEEKAVNAIIKNNEKQKDISLLSVAITALSKHKNITGVKEFVDLKLDYINSKQLETGGFETLDMMSQKNEESSIPTAYVISALIANEIDPLTDKKWIKEDRTLLDALLKFKKLNYFVYNNGKYSEYLYKDEATEQAFIALSDLKNKKSTYYNVQDGKSYKGIIKDSLFKLRDYLKTTQKRKNESLEDVDAYYGWQEALAINYTSDDVDKEYKDIQFKIKLDNKENVLSYAQDIMGIIASGQNPKNFDGKNYIQNLIKLQNDKGEFTESNKASNVYKQAYSIIALDMAEAEYNVNSAVNTLTNMVEGDNFGGVEETAWALIALSKHKDINKVSEIVNSAINYLKANQSETGGYDMAGCGDTPQYTALVIQALIANKIDILSSEWVKGNNNLVNSLIKNQLEDGTFRACESMGDYTDIISTERAFAALADLYIGDSMYKNIEPILDNSSALKKTIKEAKEYYKKDDKYNYLQSMALNILGIDKSELANKLELREDEAKRTYIVLDNSTEMYAKNIMGIIGAGGNPKDYNGKNYIDILRKSQDENGIFNIDGTSVSTQAYSIVALDMAQANYDVQKAINVLITKYESKSKPDIYTVTSTLIALSKHKEMDGINEKINKYIEDLKQMQLNTGGFDYNKGSVLDDAHEISEYDAMAIQAIIAVGKNPLGEEFKKEGKTILDAMMKFKKDNHFVYDSQKYSYTEYTDEATGMALAALMDIDSGKSIYHTLYIKEDTKEKTIREKIENAVDDLSKKALKDSITDWEAIGIARANKDAPKSYLEDINIEVLSSITDKERTILGIVATGGDPANIKGHNLIDELCKMDIPKKGGINGVIYGLIALDTGEYKIPEDNKWKREDLIKEILDSECSNTSELGKGGWSLSGGTYDVDITGMAMTALAPYNNSNYPQVQEAIQRSIELLKKVQTNTGGYNSWGSENSNSIAQALMGLCTNNVDPSSESFTKNGKNIIEALLSYKAQDGGFKWKLTDNASNSMATEQVLYALDQYLYFLDKKGLIYNWGNKNPIGKKFEVQTSYTIGKNENTQSLESDKLLTANVNVKNIAEEKADVMVIVALYNENNTMINVSYISENMTVGQSKVFKAGFKLPSDIKGYKVKTYVWDGTDLNNTTMKPLSNVSEIK